MRLATPVRVIAIAIAVAGAVDPAVTSMRRGNPRIAMVVTDSAADAALADRVASDLRKRFTVVRAPIAGAAGTVIVGSQLPADAAALASPVFVVLPSREGPTVTLDAVSAPQRSLVSARVPVTAVVRTTGAKGRRLDLALSIDGLIVDRVARDMISDDTLLSVPLTFVPTAAGVVALHVAATVAGGRRTAAADLVADVRDTRWAILFFDPRPSWMSTFVRRAIERDPRFVVTSRVVTSRGISTDAGQPPETLNDLNALGLFDAVVVGAPEALTDGNVVGLDDFLRRRGGSVVLLLDQQADGPYRHLTDVDRWETATDDSSLRVAPVLSDSGALRAGDLAWPSRLPDGALAVAVSQPGRVGKGTTNVAGAMHPVVWRSAVGAGRLVVSGALDAWRFRDDTLAAFDAFWRGLVAESAAAAAQPIEITVDKPVLAPGEATPVTVVLRDATLTNPSTDAVRAEVAVTIDGTTGTAVRMWPDGAAGIFRGEVRAPDAAGVHRLVVSSARAHAEAALVVVPTVARPAPDERDLLAAWSRAHGGLTLPAARLADLPTDLTRALTSPPHLETWYPMHSPWWVLPFVMALGYEWWSRRRRGLP